jgi:NAD+ synthase (glutamine-hydrolysing)
MLVWVAQLNPTVGAIQKNCAQILASLERAKERGVDLVVFPELALCGYPPEDLLLHAAFIDAQERALESLLAQMGTMSALIGLVRRSGSAAEKPLFNSLAVIEAGKLLGFVDKQLLPTYDVFDERRYFEPGAKSLIWELKGKRVGILICEDMWAGFVGYTQYATDPVRDLKALKPDVVINASASPYRFQKTEVRFQVAQKCATTLQCPVILCCQVGGNDQLVFDGYSSYVNAHGALVKRAQGFQEDEMVVDLKETQPLVIREIDPVEDLYKALVLGVRDYFHKQGFSKGCLGLSGGVDSALVACIAVDALGKENVLAVNMPSRFSSEGSLKDAQRLASTLQIELKTIPIEGPFQAFLESVEPLFEGRSFDVTEENIQARIRGTLLMALSNKWGYLVLSTGNKSELGLGYCTLYGDMCGGLSVISDVTKQQVYALCRFINRRSEIIPKSILEKAPSAELKFNQKDSDTLPPYDIVDQVVQGYVEEHSSCEEIAQRLGLSLDLVKDLVHKIHLAEYKRRQAAPGIRVSRRAFRVGRRYPIVQGWM